MGGDGGSIPQRADMVRTKGYTTASRGSMGFNPNGFRQIVEEGVDVRRQRQTRMQTCALSGKPLVAPIVACRCGFLFNKEEILEKLLAKSMPGRFSHISSLRDVIECRFETVGDTPICPVTRRELDDGVTRAEVCWPCGCVLSEKALAGVKGVGQPCVICGKPIEHRTKLGVDGHELEEQRKTAVALMHKKRRIDADSGGKKKTEVVASKRLQPTSGEHEAAMQQYAKSETLNQLFHDSSKEEKKDAFGRSYSRRY